MSRFYVVLATGLALSACATGPAETVRSADAAASTQCHTTRQTDGSYSMNCTLWERTTTTTTTTTTAPDGERRTTVERTRTGGDG
ncbi:hypothetical protein D3C72_891110 [compost metagenome]